jgi:hypothetical protein
MCLEWSVKVDEVEAVHASMMGWKVMLHKLVCKIVDVTMPVDYELALGDAIFDPVEAHGNDFGDWHFWMAPLAMPALLVWMGVAGGRRWPISLSVVQKQAKYFALYKSAPSCLASVAGDINRYGLDDGAPVDVDDSIEGWWLGGGGISQV